MVFINANLDKLHLILLFNQTLFKTRLIWFHHCPNGILLEIRGGKQQDCNVMAFVNVIGSPTDSRCRKRRGTYPLAIRH